MTQAGPGEIDGFVAPAYHRRSLGDVVPAVAVALGLPDVIPGGAPSDLLLPPAPSYVVFLIDGLGSELLDRYAHAAPFLAGLAATSARAPPACRRRPRRA